MELTTLAVATTIITEVIKRVVGANTRFMPLVSLVIGVGLGLFYQVDLLQAVLIGGAASGIYDLTTKTILNR